MIKLSSIRLWSKITTLALVCFSAAATRAATHDLRALSCGTWDTAGNHTVGDYFTGFSVERPHDTTSYFIFDLSSIKGKHVTNCSITIEGTKDFTFTAVWSHHNPIHQFKVGITPQPRGLSIAQITTGNHNASVWKDVRGEQDLGYKWVADGIHKGVRFDAFHYNNHRLQAAVNAGGHFAMFAISRFNAGVKKENYLWDLSKFAGAELVLHVTTSN